MKKHWTKNKGDLGTLKASARLCELGYMVLNPQTEHSPFDLVVYKESQFHRVQVKYRKLSSKGTLDVLFKTTWSDKNGSHRNYYDLKEVDVFCIYCPDTDKCYFIRTSDFRDSKSITLRVRTTKNNQFKGILFADNFLEF